MSIQQRGLTKDVSINIMTVDQAPKYEADTKMIKIKKVIIVEDGMKSGMPSVDLQCEGEDGEKYLIFATGSIMHSIGGVISGVMKR